MATRIEFITDKCRLCYSCVQICPAKAIKMEKGRLYSLGERCIRCGSCIKECPQKAIHFVSGLDAVRAFLASGQPTLALLDPTFPAVLDVGTPRQLASALKRIGFAEVWEGAIGVELVSRAYTRLLKQNINRPLIASFCPALAFYIQKHLPRLIPHLAPLVSPMIAAGRVARKLKGADWKIVYVTSCLAQMDERLQPEVAGAIDQVVNHYEVKDLLDAARVNRLEQDETEFDGPRPYLGRMLPVVGGLYRSMGEIFDSLMDEVSVTGGRRRAIRALDQLVHGYIEAKFLDIVFCEGCLEGPFVDPEISVLGRRQILARYTKREMRRQQPADLERELASYKEIPLGRKFHPMVQNLAVPKEEEIQKILQRMDKTYPDRNLDCRSCGYPTCRAKAVAVAQGLAEIEMCLPHLLDQSKEIYHRLEKSHQALQLSHQELEQAQSQLIRTEKMASLGQLAAGIAHEINNPLGSITIFSHLLLKQLPEGDPRREDLQTIIAETNRAKEIVQGLLSFARENKLQPGPTQINTVLEDVLGLVINQPLFHNIKVDKEFQSDLPTIFADEMQLKQVFFNIILNAAQAMEGHGELSVRTAVDPGRQDVLVRIADNGPGIPPEVMKKIFDPFFTTKEKGTGLGLSISYGIVERHQGKIEVETEIGKGSVFTVRLPTAANAAGAVSETNGKNAARAKNTHKGK